MGNSTQGCLGLGPRCEKGSLGQYKIPDLLESIRVERRRARSSLYWRVVVSIIKKLLLLFYVYPVIFKYANATHLTQVLLPKTYTEATCRN